MEITLNLSELRRLRKELELIEREFNGAYTSSSTNCLFSFLKIGKQEAILKLKRN